MQARSQNSLRLPRMWQTAPLRSDCARPAPGRTASEIASDWKEAKSLWRSRLRVPRARERFSSLLTGLATDGFVPAQDLLGGCFLRGEMGFPKDRLLAAHWYQKAATEFPESMLELAKLHWEGIEGIRSPLRAFTLLETGSRRGHFGCGFQLELYVSKALRSGSPQTVRWLKKQCGKSSPEGSYLLGLALQYGWTLDRDLDLARKNLSRAAETGSMRAAYHLGLASIRGDAFHPKNPLLAREHLSRAALAGHTDAPRLLSDLYADITGDFYDPKMALVWAYVAEAWDPSGMREAIHDLEEGLSSGRRRRAWRQARDLRRQFPVPSSTFHC